MVGGIRAGTTVAAEGHTPIGEGIPTSTAVTTVHAIDTIAAESNPATLSFRSTAGTAFTCTAAA